MTSMMMRKFGNVAVLACLGYGTLSQVWAQTANQLTREETAAGWKLLFDGTSLKGWEPHQAADNEQAATWAVADGAIFSTGEKRGWLATTDTYGDFQLKLEFRAPAEINSGVFIRSDKATNAPAETGYEVQIWDTRPTFKTGALVNSLEAEPTKILANQWNSFDITAQGDHFVVILNGKKLVDGRDSKHKSGAVGLQINTGTGKIEFRNIRIRPIRN